MALNNWAQSEIDFDRLYISEFQSREFFLYISARIYILEPWYHRDSNVDSSDKIQYFMEYSEAVFFSFIRQHSFWILIGVTSVRHFYLMSTLKLP